jgi:hypothetical protein
MRMHDHPATPTHASRRELRLRARVAKVAEEGDRVIAWTQGWVSREGRFHAFAARTFDYIAVTERELLLFTTGFFTRRPRRLVFAAPLDVLRITDPEPSRGRGLVIHRPRQRPLRFELRGDRHSVLVCTTLSSRVGPPDERDTTEGGNEPA